MFFIAVSSIVFTSMACAGMFWTYVSFKVVPSSRVAMMEEFGRFRAVLKPGLHFLPWPMKRTHLVHWTYNEEGPIDPRSKRRRIVRRVVRTDMIRVDNAQLDVSPCSGITADNVTVSVNGTMHYRIVDAQAAVYGTDDLLATLVDCVYAAVRHVTSRRMHMDMIGKDHLLCPEIIEHVNEKMSNFGTLCTQFLIQDIEMDRAIMDVYEKSLVAERMRAVDLAKQQAGRELVADRERGQWELNQDKVQRMHQEKMLESQRNQEQEERLAEQEIAKIELNNRKRQRNNELEGEEQKRRFEISHDRKMQEIQIIRKEGQARHEKTMAEIAGEKSRTEMTLEIEELRAQSAARVVSIQAQADAEKEKSAELARASYYVALAEAVGGNLDAHSLVQMITAPHMSAAMRGVQKIVIPTEALSNSPFAPWAMTSCDGTGCAPTPVLIQSTNHTPAIANSSNGDGVMADDVI